MNLICMEDVRRFRDYEKDLQDYVNREDKEELYVLTHSKTASQIKTIIKIRFTTLKIVQMTPNFLCIYKQEVENPQEFFEKRAIQLFANG